MNEITDQVPDPTWVERIISWIKIALATKKIIITIWAFFFGVTGTAIVGNVKEVNPWKEAGIEIGLIEKEKSVLKHEHEFIEHSHIQQNVKHEHEFTKHKHELIKHEHELIKHEHPTGMSIPDEKIEKHRIKDH